jgi:soluble lytic murein transglycosylase-like protein
LRNEPERMDSILGDRPARFNIEDDPEADPGPEIWEFAPLGKLAVSRHDNEIEHAAKKRGVDADLIRSIIWAENARGHRFGANKLFDVLGVSDSKLPMNIKPHLARLIGARPEDMTKAEVNIEAAAELIKRIWDRVEQPTAAKFGSIWQYTGQERVTDAGAAVARLYADKPWMR